MSFKVILSSILLLFISHNINAQNKNEIIGTWKVNKFNFNLNEEYLKEMGVKGEDSLMFRSMLNTVVLLFAEKVENSEFIFTDSNKAYFYSISSPEIDVPNGSWRYDPTTEQYIIDDKDKNEVFLTFKKVKINNETIFSGIKNTENFTIELLYTVSKLD